MDTTRCKNVHRYPYPISWILRRKDQRHVSIFHTFVLKNVQLWSRWMDDQCLSISINNIIASSYRHKIGSSISWRATAGWPADVTGHRKVWICSSWLLVDGGGNRLKDLERWRIVTDVLVCSLPLVFGGTGNGRFLYREREKRSTAKVVGNKCFWLNGDNNNNVYPSNGRISKTVDEYYNSNNNCRGNICSENAIRERDNTTAAMEEWRGRRFFP